LLSKYHSCERIGFVGDSIEIHIDALALVAMIQLGIIAFGCCVDIIRGRIRIRVLFVNIDDNAAFGREGERIEQLSPSVGIDF